MYTNQQDNASSNMIAPRAAAEILGCSRQTVMRRIHDGSLRALKNGPQDYSISEVDLIEYALGGFRLGASGSRPITEPEGSPLKGMLTPIDVAGMLGCSRQTVYNLIQSGELRAMRVRPRMYRIAKDDFDSYMAEYVSRDRLQQTGKPAAPQPKQSAMAAVTGMLTVKEVSRRLRVTPQTVYRMLEREELRGIRIGSRMWRVEATVLDAYMAGSRTGRQADEVDE